MEQQFPKELHALDAIFGFLDRFYSEHRIDRAPAYALSLAVEEFFTNIVKYGGSKKGEVTISAAYEPGRVTVLIVDPDGVRFDPTQAQVPQDDVPLDRRPVGGLGIHITRQMLDTVRYEYRDRKGTLTLVKNLEPQHVQNNTK